MRRKISGFALALAALIAGAAGAGEKYWVYIGTYTGPKSKGIYRAEFDAATGSLANPQLAGETASPSFVAIHPNGKLLYAVGEVNAVGGKKGGGVTAFSLDPASGALTNLNSQSSVGAGPCHINIDREGKNALVANYGGGSVAVLPIDGEGKLGEASCFIQHAGSSANPARQKGPHAHSINLDAAGKFAFVADLGTDDVFVYRFDSAAGKLTPNDPPSAKVAPGSGPRHFCFHPDGKHAFVINEMLLTVTMFGYDASAGKLTEVKTARTIPEAETKGSWSTAEVVAHPSGKFIFGSNRGHDTIATLAVDVAAGELKLIGNQGKGVKVPRNFIVDPTGKWLLVANQDGHDVIVFKIDQETGLLTPTESRIEVGSPVCLRTLERP
jgi:6-phosphogluconolactonase